MAAVWVNGQAIAKGAAKETKVARPEDDVVGIVHHGNLRAGLQVILECIQADLVDQLQEAAAVGTGAPHGDHLLGQVAIEVALQRTFEERSEAAAFGDRVLGRGDQPAAVDQVGGKGDVGCREAERGADDHGHLFVGQVLA
ncbi:hypothetical protein D3C77_451410 [compost metagenome]